MTPAITVATKARIAFTVHEYAHDPGRAAYGLEAVEKLGVSPAQVFKTLVVDVGGELVVAVIPVATQLNLKLLAKAVGVKKAALAPGDSVERVTGYVLGGVSPLGQRKRLRTVVDASALTLTRIFVSAGRRGLEIELAPQDVLRLTNAVCHEITEKTGTRPS